MRWGEFPCWMAALGCAGVVGAQSAAERALAEAAAALGDPGQSEAAFEELLAAGPRAVPALIAVLRTCQHGERDPDAGAAAALRLLGRFGGGAGSALVDVRRCLAFGTVSMRNAAMEAMAEIAAQLRDPRTCRECLDWLDLQRTPELDRAVYEMALVRLRLGAGEDLAMTLRFDDTRGAPRFWGSAGTFAAVVRALACGTVPPTPAILVELRRQLTLAVERCAQPWYERRWYRGVAGELAVLLERRGQPLAGDVALGQLLHRDAPVRLRALRALVPHGLHGDAQRLVAVELLWDPSAAVRRAARQALVDLGADGLIGLRALRAFAREGGDEAAASERAADAVLAAAGVGDDALRTVLVELDDAVRQRSVPQRAAAAPAAAMPAIAAVVWGCRGATAQELEPVLAFAGSRAGGDAQVAVAALQLLSVADAAASAVVLTALPRFAVGLRAAGLDVRWELAMAANANQAIDPALALAVTVPLAVGPGVDEQECIARLAAANARFVVRVAAELIARGRAGAPGVDAAIAAARGAANEWDARSLSWMLPEFGDGQRFHRIPDRFGGWGYGSWGSARAEFDLALALLEAAGGASPVVPASAVATARAVWPTAPGGDADAAQLAEWLVASSPAELAAFAMALEDHAAAASALR